MRIALRLSQTNSFKLFCCFRAQLMDYILDFGYVVCDTTPEFVFHATNCGYFPVSFMADKQALYNSGFTINMDRVKNLPGFPDPQSITISVVFDPRSANIPQGPVRTRVPINVSSSLLLLKVRSYIYVSLYARKYRSVYGSIWNIYWANLATLITTIPL